MSPGGPVAKRPGGPRPRLAVTGSSSPLLKLLESCRGLAVEWPVLFSELTPEGQLAATIRALGTRLEKFDVLEAPGGAERLRAYAPDWLVNVNSVFIFPEALLRVPRRGALNLHPGRLPDYAGIHAPQWAVRNGETAFAATVHWMEREVDAGPIAYQAPVALGPHDTGLSATVKCLNEGVRLMAHAIADIAAGRTPPREPQDLSRRRCYRHHEALDGTIDWRWNARRIVDFIRAADYRPFHSPTYLPQGRVRGKRLHPRHAEAVGSSAGEPGTLTACGERGLTVTAGDGRSIVIDVAQLAEGPLLEGAAIAEAAGVRPGDRFEP